MVGITPPLTKLLSTTLALRSSSKRYLPRSPLEAKSLDSHLVTDGSEMKEETAGQWRISI